MTQFRLVCFAICLLAAVSGFAQPDPAPTPDYGPVTFRCNEDEVDTLFTVSYAQGEVQQSLSTAVEYPINVYGIDGLLPVIRIDTGSPNGQPVQGITQTNGVCIFITDAAVGNTATLPGGTTTTVTEATLPSVAQLTLAGEVNYGIITMTAGAREGSGGRYLAIIGGLSLDPADETDVFRVRVGPRAALSAALEVYVIGVGENSRLDPVLRTLSDTGEVVQQCDDAGRRACAGVPAVTGAGITLAGGPALLGDRFDAGLRLPPGWVTLEVASFGGNTRGDYALLFVGSLDPR